MILVLEQRNTGLYYTVLGKRKLPRIPPIHQNNTMITDVSEKVTYKSSPFLPIFCLLTSNLYSSTDLLTA